MSRVGTKEETEKEALCVVCKKRQTQVKVSESGALCVEQLVYKPCWFGAGHSRSSAISGHSKCTLHVSQLECLLGLESGHCELVDSQGQSIAVRDAYSLFFSLPVDLSVPPSVVSLSDYRTFKRLRSDGNRIVKSVRSVFEHRQSLVTSIVSDEDIISAESKLDEPSLLSQGALGVASKIYEFSKERSMDIPLDCVFLIWDNLREHPAHLKLLKSQFQSSTLQSLPNVLTKLFQSKPDLVALNCHPYFHSDDQSFINVFLDFLSEHCDIDSILISQPNEDYSGGIKPGFIKIDHLCLGVPSPG